MHIIKLHRRNVGRMAMLWFLAFSFLGRGQAVKLGGREAQNNVMKHRQLE